MQHNNHLTISQDQEEEIKSLLDQAESSLKETAKTVEEALVIWNRIAITTNLPEKVKMNPVQINNIDTNKRNAVKPSIRKFEEYHRSQAYNTVKDKFAQIKQMAKSIFYYQQKIKGNYIDSDPTFNEFRRLHTESEPELLKLRATYEGELAKLRATIKVQDSEIARLTSENALQQEKIIIHHRAD